MMTTETLQVRPLEKDDAIAWEEYALSHPSATVFHRLAWSRAVSATYPHKALHLTAWANDRIVGILPLFFVKSAFVGRVLVSVPYATYGGILADSDEATAAMLASAEELTREHQAQYLELRHREKNALDLPEIDRYDTFRKELPARADDVMASLPRKCRAAARKGRNAVDLRIGPELLDTIYDLYSLNLRRLGSPNYRRSFFRALQEHFGNDCVCLVAYDDDKPIAGVISYVFRDEIMPYFTGCLPEGMHKNANNAMYPRLMEWAIERGLKWFDFNRTRRDNHGPHGFKGYHGFEPEPLHYQMSLNLAREMPNLTPSNRKFALAGKVWRKMPLWFTRTVGRRISNWIP